MKNYKFTADWLAGFIQTDGSFVIGWSKPKYGIFPIRPQPIFNLSQSISQLDMFKQLHAYLGIGFLTINRDNVVITVKNLDQIINILIPLLTNTPLRSGKLQNFKIFKIVCIMMSNKAHLTLVGLLQILELSYFMNKDTSLRTEESKQELLDILKAKIVDLPDFVELSLPISENIPSLNNEFVRGIIDGDGSFNVSFASSRRRVQANFTVTMELSSISVLYELVDYFKGGAVYSLPTVAARYQIQNFQEILSLIYPLYNITGFNTTKQDHFLKTIQVCEIVVNEGYKSNDNLKKIVDLAYEMNNSGKRRKLTKEEYLKKFT